MPFSPACVGDGTGVPLKRGASESAMRAGGGEGTADAVPQGLDLTPKGPDPGALLWALQRISQVADRAQELGPALRDCLPLLCEAGGWSAGHALLSSADTLS